MNRTWHKKQIKTNRTAFAILIVFAFALGAASLLRAQADGNDAEAPAVTHNTWTSGAPIPTPVYYAAAGVVKNEIYIVGGGVTYTTYTADVQIYNPVTNTWSAGVPFPTPIEAAASAVVSNVLYIFGGSSDGSTGTNAVWAFNAKTKTWSPKAAMPTARLGAVAVVDKNI
ncbi:MAG: kelch repeat-containing protein, partial [Terriglobales bacterium]